MKKLIYAATFTLVIPFGIASLSTSSVPAVYAGGVMRDANAPHLVHSDAHPNNARVLSATHHIEVQVQGNDLSQLSIDVPEEIEVSDRILITDQSDKKIDANVSVDGNRVMLAFSQPVPAGTTLSVSMKDVKTPFSLQGLTLHHQVYGRSVGMNADVPIGMARIQTYID